MTQNKNSKKYNFQLTLLSITLLSSMFAQAQSLSFQDAERQLLQSSYSSQAYNNLEQAAKLEAEASKGLGLPRIDLNVRAYAFHSEVDIPLQQLKNNLESSLSQGINGQISQWESSSGLSSGVTDPLRSGINNTIHPKCGKKRD